MSEERFADLDMANRVAIVTGGAGGIGAELVRGLVNAGANVVIADVDRGQLARLGTELANAGHEARFFPSETDVSDPRACEEIITRATDRFGPVDILVNNAAIGMGNIRIDHMTDLVEIHEVTPQLWRRFIEVNLSGAFYMTRSVMPAMLDNQWGRVINITTSFSTMLRAGFAPYGPAKAGLEAMSAGHAAEFRESGVTVNVVVPGGPTDTPMVPPESGFDRTQLISAAAMVAPILWLSSPAADHITGNRYIAADWDITLPAEQAAREAGSPIGWGDLAGNLAWPGGNAPEV